MFILKIGEIFILPPPQQDLLLAQRNINRLIRFNKQFLYYSAADTEKIELNIKMEKLDLFTSNVCENFSLLMNKKKIQFSKDIQLNQNETWFDTDKLDIILYNLLSLALKDTAQKGSINIQAYSTIRDHEDYATFKITHTYLALSDLTHELTHDKIEHLSGNINIGLAITKQMIELHRGQLEFSTSKNERSISFKIPTSYKAYQDLNPVISNNTQENINYLKNKLEIEEEVLVNLKNLTKETDKKSTIIIIDPDHDLRRILKQQLSTFFSIKEFSNAQTGLKNIFKLSPDLIICDTFTSQPFTGMDLCKEIKKSLSHSLTPVIILSGQPSESERALCYKAGTDSYIAKPIDINTLLIRVQNLIKQKIATLESVPTPINRFTKTINKGKDIFLNEIKTTVEKNISDPHFGVNELAKGLNISKSMLYRKLTNSINLSPNLFIKKIRLLRAIQLLEETTLNISEIAEQCGFNDISYFGHTFKKEYGISPSSYRQNFHKYSNRNG
ncbi:hybrid sensor histidine kinase/response regulator transcription factor [Saccharicrinis fermentans]|nr:helix-turn-helix domain-containing protein [Saccharicrinis fermentans]